MSSVLLSLVFSEGRNIAIETIGIQRPYLSGQTTFRPLMQERTADLATDTVFPEQALQGLHILKKISDYITVFQEEVAEADLP